MRESILTIPVNEAFEPKDGCPICRMRDIVEQHIAEYICGAAMMEPDVRIETNRLGFCHTHYEMLMKQRNPLAVGLMMNTYLAGVKDNIFRKKGLLESKDKKLKAAAALGDTCFICEKVNWGIDHMLETVFTMFKNDEGFKKLLAEQEFICVPHYALLTARANEKLQKGDLNAFTKLLDGLMSEYIAKLGGEVDTFCNSFDYRNAGKLHTPEMEGVRKSVPRAVKFLTGRDVDEF